MNHLAHLHLAGGSPHFLAGNLAADFFAGEDLKNWPELRMGILFHREVDDFTDNHPIVRECRALIDGSPRHCRGILVDIFFDHLLICNWKHFDSRSHEVFVQEVCAKIVETLGSLPPRLEKALPGYLEHNWLYSCSTRAHLESLLKWVSRRLGRGVNMGKGLLGFDQNFVELERLFLEFYPMLQKHVHLLDR